MTATTATDWDTEPGLLYVDPEAFADMDEWHRRAAEIRESTPLLPVELDGYEPFFVVTRYADLFAISRDNDRWLNTTKSVIGPEAEWQRILDSGMPLPRTLIHLDGHDHKAHRQVAADWFRPAAVKSRQGRIEELATQFVDKMHDLGGECDFARDIAQPYTLRVIMDIYGVPEEDEPLMLDLTQGIFGAGDPEFIGDAEDPGARVIESVMSFVSYFDALTEDRRAHPTDDLATVIANGQVDGCPMGDAERLWYFIIVATAGHDTTSFALAGGLEAMTRDPSQLWALRDDPSLVHAAAEETIRWTSPVRSFLRYATEDLEVAGTTVPAGGRVLLSYPSANRDEAMFEAGMTFDVRRPHPERLASFGAGAHFCLGSQFARREVRTMYGVLSRSLATLEPAGAAEWAASSFVSGVKHLPVRYTFR
jgi:cytochrome P450